MIKLAPEKSTAHCEACNRDFEHRLGTIEEVGPVLPGREATIFGGMSKCEVTCTQCDETVFFSLKLKESS